MLNYLLYDYSRSNIGTCLCLGKFDGVHAGHQKLIQKVVEVAQSNNLASLAICLYPNPKVFSDPDLVVNTLTDIPTRVQKIYQLGVDFVDVIKFDKVLSEFTAQEFVDYLIDFYNLKIWIVGSRIIFGKDAEGNLAWLQAYCELKDFKIIVCDYLINQKGQILSSTLLREDG
jgi:riboflavin kinase / FMN adenylyltransferase